MASARPQVLRTVAEVRAWRRGVAAVDSAVLGFVPTMGAVHSGHQQLVRHARDVVGCSHVAASVFVNPTQFGPGEDFESYPRTLDADVAALGASGADVVFAPTAAEMYPLSHPGPPVAVVDVPGATASNEGGSRPHFFRGVCTVVTKLLNVVAPDVLVLGQKDGQQCLVVSTMVKELLLPVTVEVAPTVREPDGLALSSRNAYLSAAERAVAPQLYESLQAVAADVQAGVLPVDAAAAAMKDKLAAGSDLWQGVDYVSCLDKATGLELCGKGAMAPPAAPALLCVAARLGTTRLLDNVTVCADPKSK